MNENGIVNLAIISVMVISFALTVWRIKCYVDKQYRIEQEESDKIWGRDSGEHS